MNTQVLKKHPTLLVGSREILSNAVWGKFFLKVDTHLQAH